MRSLLLLVIVLSLSPVSLAEICGDHDCGSYSCCLDNTFGPLCYSPSTYSCLLTSATATNQRKLCPLGQQACGKHCFESSHYMCDEGRLCPYGMHACGPANNFACYDSMLYMCVNDQLHQVDPHTNAPSTQAPSTQAPSTHAPSTAAPSTQAPSTHAPSTAAPSTHAPSTHAPSTHAPSTQAPSTQAPSTQAPSTHAPSTHAPSTASPSTQAPSTHAPSTAAPSTQPPSNGNSSVKLYGIDYNPRTKTGACPSLADVEQDLRILAAVTDRIRLYSIVDCNAGQLLIQALESTGLNLKITLGIWLDQYFNIEFPNEYNALLGLINGVGLRHVEGIIVGSETQYRKDFSASILIGFLNNVSATIQDAGYTNIHVSTADVIYNLMGSPILNEEQVVYVNQFPFWEGATIEAAPGLLQQTVATLQRNVGNKPVIVSETGWPTCGDNFGNSVPSHSNLKKNMMDVVCYFHKHNVGYFWFQAFDQPWQSAAKQGGVEQCFGLFTADKQLKEVITLPLMCPQ